jgi:type IV pilus assembly protein PilA
MLPLLARALLYTRYRRLRRIFIDTAICNPMEIPMKKVQQGFTLIELMIVVAIIGILAAIAIPAYQDYTIRAQVSEGLSLAGAAKAAVTEYYQDQGTFPTNNTEAGLDIAANISGKYVSTVTVASNVITIAYSNAGNFSANSNINGADITLTATDNGGSVAWDCAGGTTLSTNPKWLPAACR